MTSRRELRRRGIALAALALFMVMSCDRPGASLEFTGFVVDQADMFDAGAEARITRKLDDFQRTTGHQMAVVTVNSLDGEDITRFTARLGNRWGVGRKGFDDGILILLAAHERQARIAVAHGLERRLTDEFASEILERRMMPAFQRLDFASGVDAGASAIIALFQPPPAVERATEATASDRHPRRVPGSAAQQAKRRDVMLPESPAQ